MSSIREYLPTLILVVIAAAGIYLLYGVVSPIAFLLGTGITFILLFFFILYFRPSRSERSNSPVMSAYAKKLAVPLLFILFGISIKVLKDYQLPEDDYFTNIDHHTIKNTGVAFSNSLDLYQDKGDTATGIWSCESGSFKIISDSNLTTTFQFLDFFIPVMGKTDGDRFYLVNPVFQQPVAEGFTIGDTRTKLTWSKLSSHINGNDETVFSFDMVFSTVDTFFFADSDADFEYRDTIHIEELTLVKGLDLKSIFKKSEQFKDPFARATVIKFLDRVSQIYLIPQCSNAGEVGLHLFPSRDFFERYSAGLNGVQLAPRTSNDVPFNAEDQFYAGVENSRKLLRIRQLQPSEKEILPEGYQFLEINEFASYSMKAAAGDLGINKVQIRFLKNNYQQLGFDEIREGFLFHDDIKANQYTSFDAVIKYHSGPATSPLQYSIAGENLRRHNTLFSLPNAKGSLSWCFKIDDLSRNPYDFGHNRWYLFLLITAILSLLIFRPGSNLYFIEVPVLIVIYLFMVFRLLLLWRVATFPPLTNIKASEYNTLQEFDMKFFTPLPLPFSLLFVLFALLCIFLYRSKTPTCVAWLQTKVQGFWMSRKARPVRASVDNSKTQVSSITNTIRHQFTRIPASFRTPAFMSVVYYGLTLAVCYALQKFIPWEQMKRITKIVLPIVVYFIGSARVLSRNIIYTHRPSRSRSKLVRYAYDFVNFAIESPIFMFNILTVLYLMRVDKGFGILFVFFLLLKTTLFSFHRPTYFKGSARIYEKGGHLYKPSAYFVYGIITLLIYLGAIGYKRAFFYILEYKLWIIGIALFLAIVTFTLLKTEKLVKACGVGIISFLFVAFLLPAGRNFVSNNIEDAIKLVKYRTSILVDPIENILFENEFNSGKEIKIIETAQSQWFINSYLNTAPPINRKINLLEHFNTGVDYTTQTRDVVLPRFVIGEHGSTIMVMLLILAGLPVTLFFLSYGIVARERQFSSGSVVSAMALILFFTIALFVWLSSTNRFVFFGQDFPFLSLTSRVSTFLPIILFSILLLQKPMLRQPDATEVRLNLIRWFILATVLILVIGIAGRSSEMTARNFKIDFTSLRSSISRINEIYSGVQSGQKFNPRLTEKDIRENSDLFYEAVAQSLKQLFAHNDFKAEYRTARRYQQSILDDLLRTPRLGLQLSSPIHLRYDSGEKKFSLVFNQYWRLELPAYDVEDVWQGDITEQVYGSDTLNQSPQRYRVAPFANVIVVPSSYLRPEEKPVGLLFMQGKQTRHDSCFIFDKQTRTMALHSLGDHVAKLSENNIFFYINGKDNQFRSWAMGNVGRQYFAYNFLINGRQKHIYPQGREFYWIRHWASASKSFFQTKKDLFANTTISLDYFLNQKVSRLLQTQLTRLKADLPELSFSVIGADGTGQIRLMCDFAAQREIIDPNDDRQVLEKENEQYFNIDSRMERLQWGNLNLLQMNPGPGSSIKPLVSAAITSQLKAEWRDLIYQPGQLGETKDGKPAIEYYAGLDLRRQNWPVESSNRTLNFTDFISQSNNLYHSVLMFLGAYEPKDFYRDGRYSLANVLRRNAPSNAPPYPVVSLGNNDRYFLADISRWPQTSRNPVAGEKITWFGNKSSLLANGLNQNFDLPIEPDEPSGEVHRKDSFSRILPDTVTKERTWSSPETSHFLQNLRVSEDTIQNFNDGLRFPTLGGKPWTITPMHMLEMFGKLISQNPLYRVSIDKPQKDWTVWNKDPEYNAADSYESFLVNYIFKGMEDVLRVGTARALTQGRSTYKGYHLYGKTGTIGNMANDNSKRLAMIITKDAVTADNFRQNRFYVLYFTIGNAYHTDDSDKSWFWTYYKQILDAILESKSFTDYMK